MNFSYQRAGSHHLLLLWLLAAYMPCARADDFDSAIRPLLNEYCLTCHSTEKHKGDFDLEQQSSLAALRRHPKPWQQVLEQLVDGEMPPKNKPQPSPDQKEILTRWVRASLDAVAMERAGDPGPVVLRRLSNAEYTYTIRDLTGVESLDPAKEFPVDGAAGEGFTNTGQSLVMSPSLVTKYLDAGKAIASHAVLLPEGIRFSPGATPRDWTEERLTEIRRFYARFTTAGGADKAGCLPLDQYFAATLEVRDGGKTVDAVAREHGLSAKYLETLIKKLNAQDPSVLLDGLRTRWRETKPENVPAMVAEIGEWQKTLWKFNSVGHIGKAGGPKAWMEPVNPIASQQEFRMKLTAPANANEIVIYLTAGDAGDGPVGDFVVWQQPKLIIPGRDPILLRDVQKQVSELVARRDRILGATTRALAAAAAQPQKSDVAPELLKAWFDYLGIGTVTGNKLDHFTHPIPKSGQYDFVKGWGSPELPFLLANSSDQTVQIPGNMKAHGVVVHPTQTLAAAAGWQSPVTAKIRISAAVTDAHTTCGNGVVWSLELRHGGKRQRLKEGVTDGGKTAVIGPLENVPVEPGDLVSLIIDPRNGEHTCDLTDLELTLSTVGDAPQEWSLTRDVSGDILAGNPHSDSSGHQGVWHFYSEPVSGTSKGTAIPPGSLLARWQEADKAEEKQKLAEALQQLLTSAQPAGDGPDSMLYRQLTSLNGPLLSSSTTEKATAESPANSIWGINPTLFGKHPNGGAIDPASICVQAPSVIEVRLPAELFSGSELATTGALDAATGGDGSVQLQILTTKPTAGQYRLQPSGKSVAQESGAWNSSNPRVSFVTPILTCEGGAGRKRLETAFEDFRQLFPAAVCYMKIVPVDEIVTLTLFHREDDHFARLLLYDVQKAQLDRMWNELRFISQDALTLVDAFEQLWQYSTQDGPNAPNGDERLKPLGVTIKQHASDFRARLIDAEPRHVEAVIEFADRAYRRPLTDGEKSDLRGLYHKLRDQELPHEEAVRLTLARVLVGPAFLYKSEKPVPGKAQAPVSDGELANRLSYFLWSSMPDAELRSAAAEGKLHEPNVLVSQTRRMLGDARVRRMATEFACSWMHIHDFDTLDEKSERHFPEFAALRSAMYEEPIRFFTDFFQGNRSILGILDADYTFLNESLAKHYGIPGVTGEEWRRVDGLRKFSRGGILGQAANLAKQSGASRTSPILRGNWVAEVLLGDKLPRPPKDVPRLPEDEATETLTVRQLTEKHSTDPSCQACHVRIDAFGFALENFDAIGRARDKDLAGRPIDAHAKTMDGAEFSGIDGLRDYLLNTRRDAFLRQFCRKLLGYSLGRAVQLSDEPLLKEIQTQLAVSDYHINTAIELIVLSRQFREIRGRDVPIDD